MSTFDIELVGKVGSLALINREYQDLDYNIIARLSRELKPGYIWVTSGATEIGKIDYIKRNGHELSGSDEENKTDYASQGQSILMATYRDFIDSRYSVRQILVEHQHFNDMEKRKHLLGLLTRCPSQNAIPIINYNDAVSYDENRKMEVEKLRGNLGKAVECVDNDETASQIACLVKCKTLLILSTTDGIYSDIDDKNSLIERVSGKDIYELIENIEELQTHCHGASRKGAHGARAKLEYIKEPVKNGTQVIISNSRYSIADVLSGKVRATKIGL
ncbi:MAG TPA: uridylate kinase [Clostridia bacterium]|nr:uridylate kinase [Clostridia bacterium]